MPVYHKAHQQGSSNKRLGNKITGRTNATDWGTHPLSSDWASFSSTGSCGLGSSTEASGPGDAMIVVRDDSAVMVLAQAARRDMKSGNG